MAGPDAKRLGKDAAIAQSAEGRIKTFPLLLDGEWVLVDNQFAFRYQSFSHYGHSPNRGLLIAAERSDHIELEINGLELRSFSGHNGPKGEFDLSFVNTRKGNSCIAVGNYKLTFEEVITPPGHGLILTIASPKEIASAMIDKTMTPDEIVQGLATERARAVSNGTH